jgi:hypothetical protein
MKRFYNLAFAACMAAGLLCSVSFSALSQKLPKVQINSVTAPANIRIDGRLNEWGDQFQAYNKHTNVFYTIANDNERLYLVLKATDRAIAGKIIAGGVTLAVNPSGEKKDKNQVAITFPMYDQDNTPDINIVHNPDLLKQGSKEDVNAIISQANKQLIRSSKEIKLSGTKIITDTLISVYNDAGIKVAARFNSKGDYIYELAIPIKYLGLSIDKQTKFTYNVRLNESPHAPVITTNTPSAIAAINNTLPPPVQVRDIDIFQTTDFWGAYTLAKK